MSHCTGACRRGNLTSTAFLSNASVNPANPKPLVYGMPGHTPYDLRKDRKMSQIKTIRIKQQILSDNDNLANEIRNNLKANDVFMVNIMSSPGAGKTTLLLETIRRLGDEMRVGVIEGDIESMCDAEKITEGGALAVQINTGGSCHLDAPMVQPAIESIDLDQVDILFLENIGNLVCPAEFDAGAMRRVMLLSIPEGDDKVMKYPLMFSVCDALIITKTDCMNLFDFDVLTLKKRVVSINPKIKIIMLCSKTGEGMDEWINWLRTQRGICLDK